MHKETRLCLKRKLLIVQAYEDAHIGTTPFFAKYNGMHNLQQQECCDFRKALEKHRNILRRFDPDCLGRCERILNVVLEGGLFYGDSGQYYRSCFYVVVNRWDRLDAVDATVVVLDGTADIHPNYDTQDVTVGLLNSHTRASSLMLRFPLTNSG